MKLESIVQFLDTYLGIHDHPDYPTALNGLQVEGSRTVRRVCAAVDASEAAIERTIDLEGDLLLVHHGMFWEGLQPVTGRRHRKLSRLIGSGTALYSAHLPLDGHPEVGNCILLARALGLEVEGRFGAYQGAGIGWWGRVETDREGLRERLGSAVGGPVRLIPGGAERVTSVGVVTGGGGSFVEEAVDRGLDAYVTGEGSHHTFVDAEEGGLNLYYAGHYATETAGVKALAAHAAATFDLTWEFIDLPSGL